LKILISGMMRSGTTLLQKALNTHPQLMVSYQTKTDKFIALKQEFLQSIDINDYHVMSHYSPQNKYSFETFISWLDKQQGGADILVSDDVSTSEYFGVKEVLMEEFYPVLVTNNVKCLNIIRDPRDVITSMSFGSGVAHTGTRRPILFDLRNWRKSVLISAGLASSKQFFAIKFEDLILNSESTLCNIYEWLNISQLSYETLISDMNNNEWSNNSSFGEKKLFDPSALGNYKENLPENVTKYIEAVCYEEMKHLGYPLTITELDRINIIQEFKEPFESTRAEFDSDYTKKSKDYELNRCETNFDDLIKTFLVRSCQ
jgi:hypothetical protein